MLYDHIKKYIYSDEPPFPDPLIPCHIQATEIGVQLLTIVSGILFKINRDAVSGVLIETGMQLTRLESVFT